MKSFNVIGFVQYFKNIASLHAGIKGFYIMDINEILEGLRNEVQYPALILNTVSGLYNKKPNRDNITNTVKSGFLIIDHLDQAGDFAAEISILHNTFEIGHSILSKLDNDSCQQYAPHIGIDVDSIKYEMVDQIFDNAYGWLFTFDMINQALDLVHDPKYWLTQGKSGMVGFGF